MGYFGLIRSCCSVDILMVVTTVMMLLFSSVRTACAQPPVQNAGDRATERAGTERAGNLRSDAMTGAGAAAAMPAPTGAIRADGPGGSTGGDELLLRTAQGDLIPLQEILGTGYSNIVDDLLNRVQQQLVVPNFHLADLELSGSIQRDVVQVTAALKIQVNRQREWVSVPIAFSDLHITGFEHQAEASEARHVPETSNPAQKKWHLYGSGLHTLRLQMIGKTRPQSPSGHSLNVDLPRATQSHAMISFATPVEIQKLTTDAVSRVQRQDSGVSAIEFWGLDPTFGISWLDVVTQVARKPVVQVQSNRMKLDLTTIPVTLSGTQSVLVSVSPLSEFQLVLPNGFQLLELVVRSQTGSSIVGGYKETATPAGLVVDVELTGPAEGLLSVIFDLELVNRSFPQDIQIRLPVLPDVNTQPGDLDILIPPGLLVQQTRVEGAQRKRVSAESDINVASTAFRLRSAESLVTLHVEEIEAQYAVSPEMEFRPDGSNVLLTARFPINVLRGSLLDLKFRWPGYVDSQWKLLPATTLLVSEKLRIPLSPEPSDGDPDSFLLTFPERQSGQFWVEFQAFAPLAAVRSPDLAIICPQVESRSNEAIFVTTIESDDYSLQPIDSATARPLAAAPYRSSTEVSDQDPQNSRSWILDPQDTPVWFDVTAQAASVTAETLVELRAVETGIAVVQEMDFTIEHRDLSAISLVVPEGIQPLVRVSGETEPLRASLDSANGRSYRLNSARRGQLKLLIEYLVPVGAKNNEDVTEFDLPLVLPQPQSYEMRQCEVGSSVSSGIRVRALEAWTPVFSERFEASWLIQGAVSSVPLLLRPAVSFNDSGSPRFVASRTTLTKSEATTRTLAVFSGNLKEFSFEVPSGTVPMQVSVNGAAASSVSRMFKQERDNAVVWRAVFTEAWRNGIQEPSSPPVCAVEVTTRQQILRQSSLTNQVQFDRANFGTDAVSLPTIWLFESQENLRVVSNGIQQPLSRSSGIPFVPGKSGDVATVREIDALLSTCSAEVRQAVHSYIDEWLYTDGLQPEVFFQMSDVGRLSLVLIPRVSLLLFSAVICVVSFGLSTLFRPGSLLLPLLFFAAVVPAVFLIWPQWTVVLLPYVLIGVLLGLVALVFQRATSDRSVRWRQRPGSADALTVFGVSEFLNDGSASSRGDVVVAGRVDRFESAVR